MFDQLPRCQLQFEQFYVFKYLDEQSSLIRCFKSCDFFYPNRLHYISCAIRKFVYDVSSQVILYFTIIVGKFVLCFKDRKRKKMRPRFARVKKVYIIDSTNKLPFILTSFCSPVKMVKRGIRWVEICRICQSL